MEWPHVSIHGSGKQAHSFKLSVALDLVFPHSFTRIAMFDRRLDDMSAPTKDEWDVKELSVLALSKHLPPNWSI